MERPMADVLRQAPTHRRQGRLQPGHQRRPRRRRRGHRQLVPPARGAGRAGARSGHGLQRRHRRRHEAPGLDARGRRNCTSCRPPPPSGRWAWRRCTRRKLREHGMRSAQVLLTHADLADRERYLNARSTLADAAGAEGHPGDQRERHRRQRRDQVRRQRHAGRAGGQPGRGRCAGDPDRPAWPVLGRPAQGPAGALHRRGRRRRPRAGAHGRRRRLVASAAAA